MLQKQMTGKFQNNFYIEANINNKYLETYGPFSKEAAFNFLINDLLSYVKESYKTPFFLSSILYLVDNNQNKIIYLKRNLSRINDARN